MLATPVVLSALALVVVLVGFPANTIVAFIIYAYLGAMAAGGLLCLLVLTFVPNDALNKIKIAYVGEHRKELASQSVSIPLHLGCALIFFAYALYFFVGCAIISMLFYQADSWLHKK